jgi:hypothetical protein
MIGLIMKDYFQFILFIGVYVLIFVTLEVIPFEIDIVAAMVMGLSAMAGVFLSLVFKGESFNRDLFLRNNLIFTFLFCAFTVIYDKTVGLTEVTTIGNSISFRNSSFYEATLSINHAIIISAIILLSYSLIIRKKKPITLSILNILVLSVYLYLVV